MTIDLTPTIATPQNPHHQEPHERSLKVLSLSIARQTSRQRPRVNPRPLLRLSGPEVALNMISIANQGSAGLVAGNTAGSTKCSAHRLLASFCAALTASATFVSVGLAAVEVGITPLPPT